MTTNLFVIANVKQLRTDGSFRILLPFFRTYWGVGVLNSANFSIFHNRVEFGTILEGLRNFRGRGGGEAEPPQPPGTPLCIFCAVRCFIIICSSWLFSDYSTYIRRVQPRKCNVSPFIYFCKTLYMFQTGFLSIIRSSKLHIQRQVLV